MERTYAAVIATHLMSAADAVEILAALARSGVDVRLGGGWCVDALVGRQTRPHADLDLWLPALGFEHAVAVFAEIGVDRLYPWGGDRPWNFVLHDGGLRRVDLHIFEVGRGGSLHYGGFESGTLIPAEALGGTGRIGDREVRCEAPEWSLRWHTGYPPRPQDDHDVAVLRDRFGLAVPAEFG